MFLKKLSILNFKNYEEAQIEFSGKINCFLGNNGEGKTNLLDAIYYLSFCKSFFNPVDSQNIRHEEPFFVVEALDHVCILFLFCLVPVESLASFLKTLVVLP